MSDRFPAKIVIGGTIHKVDIPDLVTEILKEGDSSLGDWGEEEVEVSRVEIEKTLLYHKFLILRNSAATGGMFEELEAFLVAKGIHYDRHSDAYQEYDAEYSMFRGGKVRTYNCCQNGELLVPVTVLQDVIDFAMGSSAMVQDTLRELIAIPMLAHLNIIQ